MRTLLEANLPLIAVALLIGLLVGIWMFRRRAVSADSAPTPKQIDAPAALHPVARRDGREKNSVIDQGAAATADVAGHLLDMPVHDQLPGADGPPDNLETMKGVGPKLVTRMHDNGVTRFDQIARLTPNEVAILDDKMGPFKGRIVRDRIVEQAYYLARGDTDGFEAKFGKLGSGA